MNANSRRSLLLAGAMAVSLSTVAWADSIVTTDQVPAGGAGGGATSLISQTGSYNYGTIDQSGGYVSLQQNGNNNRAAISAFGSSITTTQIGNGLNVTVSGNGPSVTITQTKPNH
jgi:hypothetical protein